MGIGIILHPFTYIFIKYGRGIFMEISEKSSFNLYKDIQARTNGEIYIGVVGPVRTGKSTFIKRFMDLLVIPNIVNQPDKIRANDELPQSSAGRTIMTTEPKFIPKEAVNITVDSMELKVRLIDCVGFMVNGAAGHLEDDKERMVKTPWSNEPIPFTRAAEIGTNKVIYDHSTVGIVITGDGSFGDFGREDYREPEERTIKQLKSIGKPFVVVLNSTEPKSPKTREISEKLSGLYDVAVLPVDCQNLSEDDINSILASLLKEFPVEEIRFEIPKWWQMLEDENEIKEQVINTALGVLTEIDTVNDAGAYNYRELPDCIDNMHTLQINLANGVMSVEIKIDNKYYFEMLSDMCGEKIENEYELIRLIKNLTEKRGEFNSVSDAVNNVHINGFSVVTPTREQINVWDPVVIKNGNKYGVRIKADATTIYMLNTNIQTEIAPIVGSEQQAEDLIKYINESRQNGEDGMWNTNIFGKTLEQIVKDGLNDKIRNITEDNMVKLKETVEKVMNDNTGLVCLIV